MEVLLVKPRAMIALVTFRKLMSIKTVTVQTTNCEALFAVNKV